MLSRRELLSGLFLITAPMEIREARAEVPSAQRPKEATSTPAPNYAQKALVVYAAARKTAQTNKDYITPAIVEVEGPEHLVSVARVFEIGNSRYTITTSAYFTDKTKQTMVSGKGGMEICRRTHGERYNQSIICVSDNNLDGIVESGMTRILGRVITPTDKDWNQVCDETIFCGERRPYQRLFQQTYERALDDIIGHLRLTVLPAGN